MKGLKLILAVVVIGTGCSRLSPITTANGPADIAGDSAIAPPVVQIREFPHSAVVSVLAWEQDDASLGLRTSVTRTGRLVGGLRAGDHQLYVGFYEARYMGGFKYATIEEGKLLLSTGTRSDPEACLHSKVCTPWIARGVRIPDDVLRAHRDSLVVTFHPPFAEAWSVSLRPELVKAYLARVDSVVAAQR